MQHVSEQDMKKGETEWIELNYHFTFGDLVQVTGYDKDVFRIVGFVQKYGDIKMTHGKIQYTNCHELRMVNG